MILFPRLELAYLIENEVQSIHKCVDAALQVDELRRILRDVLQRVLSSLSPLTIRRIDPPGSTGSVRSAYAKGCQAMSQTHYHRTRLIKTVATNRIQEARRLLRVVDAAVPRIGIVEGTVLEPRLRQKGEKSSGGRPYRPRHIPASCLQYLPCRGTSAEA